MNSNFAFSSYFEQPKRLMDNSDSTRDSTQDSGDADLSKARQKMDKILATLKDERAMLTEEWENIANVTREGNYDELELNRQVKELQARERQINAMESDVNEMLSVYNDIQVNNEQNSELLNSIKRSNSPKASKRRLGTILGRLNTKNGVAKDPSAQTNKSPRKSLFTRFFSSTKKAPVRNRVTSEYQRRRPLRRSNSIVEQEFLTFLVIIIIALIMIPIIKIFFTLVFLVLLFVAAVIYYSTNAVMR